MSQKMQTHHIVALEKLSLIKCFFEGRLIVEQIPKSFNQIQYFLVFLEMQNKIDKIA